jgi:diguanylate cyclase (GGDEF)-like protein
MDASGTAAQVMHLAQGSRAADALALADEALAGLADDGAAPLDLAALLYARAVAHHVLDAHGAQVEDASRCLAAAETGGSSGWAANALTIRAMAHARSGAIDLALTDLAQAQVRLVDETDAGLRCWAHTGLGYCYDHLRLYELAAPHFEAAVALGSPSPIPLAEAPVIDLLNLVELHLKWALEGERAGVDDESATRARFAAAQAWSVEAERVAQGGDPSYARTARRMALVARAGVDPVGAVSSLQHELSAALVDDGSSERSYELAIVAAALSRALLRLGRCAPAVDIARRAVELAGAGVDWQVDATARHQLVEALAACGVEGAKDGLAYAVVLTRAMWEQRISLLHAARDAVEVEQLRRDTDAERRAAREDPLTGLANRRAVDEALVRTGTDADQRTRTLVLLDLDGFKAVNDRHGHALGDVVLRRVGQALTAAARDGDLVARLGGDEFVVVSDGVPLEAVDELVRRWVAAVDAIDWSDLPPGLRLSASVGVARSGVDLPLERLLARADDQMYARKRARRPVPGQGGGAAPTDRDTASAS